jgi:hypothetical protein
MPNRLPFLFAVAPGDALTLATILLLLGSVAWFAC